MDTEVSSLDFFWKYWKYMNTGSSVSIWKNNDNVLFIMWFTIDNCF